MQPTRNERVIAALAHASIVANFLTITGLLTAVLLWVMQRERSPYVYRHALQAAVYQVIMVSIGLILVFSWSVCLGLSLLPVVLRPELFRGSLPNAFWLVVIGLVVPVVFTLAATVYGLYGALLAYRGQGFQYVFVGRLVEQLCQPGVVPITSDSAGIEPIGADSVSVVPVATSSSGEDAASVSVIRRSSVRRRVRRGPHDRS